MQRHFVTSTTITGLFKVGMYDNYTLANAVSHFYDEHFAHDPSQIGTMLIHEVQPEAAEYAQVAFVTQNSKKEPMKHIVDLSPLLADTIDPYLLHKLLGVVRYVLPAKVRAQCIRDHCGEIIVATGQIVCPRCESVMENPPEKPDGLWWCPDPFCDCVVRRGEPVWAQATRFVAVCGSLLKFPPHAGSAYCVNHQQRHTVEFWGVGAREAVSGGLVVALVV